MPGSTAGFASEIEAVPVSTTEFLLHGGRQSWAALYVFPDEHSEIAERLIWPSVMHDCDCCAVMPFVL